MLKDLADSKRLNTSIQQLPADAALPSRTRRQSQSDSNLSFSTDIVTATILSELFWPPLPREAVRMPSEVGTTYELKIIGTWHSKRAFKKSSGSRSVWLRLLDDS